MQRPQPLPAEALRWIVDPDALDFETTEDIDPIEGVVGQSSAVEALSFGLQIDAPGQNVFVRGLVGTGRLTLVRDHLERLPPRGKPAEDRIYVHNFDAPDRPRLLSVPAGEGRRIADAMDELVQFVEQELTARLSDEALAAGKKRLEAAAEAEISTLSDPLEAKLEEAGLALGFRSRQDGQPVPIVLPRLNGEAVPPERIQQALQEGEVDPKELEALGAKASEFEADLARFQSHATGVGARLRASLQDMVRGIAREALEARTAAISARHPALGPHLRALVDDLVQRHLGELEEPTFTRLYAVNVFSEQPTDGTRRAVVENAPSVQSLLGSIDPVVLPDGTMHAPHMGLHAGALVRADGGTLILDARDLASTPGAWQALTRTLRSGQVELTPDPEITTRRQPGLKPDPIPVDIKVVLLGEAGVYHALDSADPDFPHLFKVLVDFDDTLPRDLDGQRMLARVLARIVRDEALPPLTNKAVAALVEHAARVAARPDVITARFGRVADIAREAVWVARRDGEKAVCARHVVEAVRRTKQRAGRAGRQFRDSVRRGILRIATSGSAVGQINGLATTQAGQLTYGFPSRITATVGPGSRGTINIEGEAMLSGAIHTKAFAILGGALRTLLPTSHPLTFDASIAFEQSYGGIDGDSASGAEVCVLLSALTSVPLHQGRAMTGAIDQYGNILAIGAANEKIEGFFDTCSEVGLTGDQGCLIPASNVGDLMLRADVVEACRQGRFHVWPVTHVREALAVLTDEPVGELDDRGEYPPGTIMERAMAAARALWEQGRERS